MPKLLRAAVICFVIGGLAFLSSGFLDAFTGRAISSGASFLSAIADAAFCWAVWMHGKLMGNGISDGDGFYRYSYQFIGADGKPVEREDNADA